MSAPSRRRPVFQRLRLRDHLERCTPAELQEFFRFWSPHDRNDRTRVEIADRLRRLMADETVVHSKVDLLSEKVRAVLLALLRQHNYASDLQGLYKGADGLELEHYEAEAALTALARRGFVRIRRARDWLHYGRNTYAVPTETGRVLHGLAGADRRTLAEIFVHASFRPFGGGAEAGALPESVGGSLQSLPKGPLASIARQVIEGFGGIITLHEFNRSGRALADGRRKPRWHSRRFLREYLPRGLGTVGHLDLRGHGVGLDDDALVFFHEVVERHLDERDRLPLRYDAVLRGRGDLMTDVGTALALVRDSEVRVGKDGVVYKTALERMAEQFIFPLQPLVERSELSRRVVSIVRGLGLAEPSGAGRLDLSPAGAEWLREPLLEKVRASYERLCDEGEGTLRARHLARLRGHLVELL
ncbi:MAG: hypothetical protein ACE5JG_08805, partial [Planctomycetota bacterium]